MSEHFSNVIISPGNIHVRTLAHLLLQLLPAVLLLLSVAGSGSVGRGAAGLAAWWGCGEGWTSCSLPCWPILHPLCLHTHVYVRTRTVGVKRKNRTLLLFSGY